MTEHPITPPPELVQQWASEFYGTIIGHGEASIAIANQAARWGSGQELEACCKALDQDSPGGFWSDRLRAVRRPKAPSLRELAQRILVENGTTLDGRMELDPDDIAIIRRALEQLDD